MIQQNINQIISLTGLLASQTPYSKARTEEVAKKRAATAEYKQVKTEFENVNKEINKQKKEMNLTQEEVDDLWEQTGQSARSQQIALYELRYSPLKAETLVENTWGDIYNKYERQADTQTTAPQPTTAHEQYVSGAEKLIEEQNKLRAARNIQSGKVPNNPYAGQISYRR